MRRMVQFASILAFLLGFSLQAQAQLTIVKDGKPTSRIVLAEKTAVNEQAATLLQDFVQRISQATLPIVNKGKTKKGDILIGNGSPAGEDGFTLDTTDGQLQILSGGDRGAIYGVVTLLEDYLGVFYYTKDTYSLTPSRDITLPAIQRSETPAFRVRMADGYGMEDPIYKMWYRLETSREMFIEGMWCHTLGEILPAEIYAKTHPEYYAYFNGKRHPSPTSQWCLTNPDLFEVVAQRLDSIFKAHPDMNLISVSQEDNAGNYCTCPECTEVNEYEGSLAGSIIRFMNKLAERFPDKEFSTLAYQYSTKPPKHVKPLPNVNIMLCNIDCRREVPLTDNPSGQLFMQDLTGWSKISNNLFIWDYGTDFDNLITPFPNFHILQKNIQLFKENHATMHFSQIECIKGGDFSELRHYMVNKLMWNPYLDADSLMQTFMKGYYGDAAPYLTRYREIMQGALLASNKELKINDSPASHKNGMLNTHLIKTYNELFDQAEKAVANDPTLLERVHLSRIPLQFAELEMARTKLQMDRADIAKKLKLFDDRVRHFGIGKLNGPGEKVVDYRAMYEKRFLCQREPNKALGAKLTWIEEPREEYKESGKTVLCDGLLGGNTTNDPSWVGSDWGKDIVFVLDMGEEKEFSCIETDALQMLAATVFLPVSVTYTVSSDNSLWQPFGSYSFTQDRDNATKYISGKVEVKAPVKARYIKVELKNVGVSPDWHWNLGDYPSFYVDEVSVY